MEAVGWEVFAAIRLKKRFDRGGRLIYVVFAFLGIVHGFEQTGWPLLAASTCMSSSQREKREKTEKREKREERVKKAK